MAETSIETFPAGTYNVTLYAEFAGYCDENELSYYQVNTSVFHVIFSGPEGGSGYVSPPVNKSFNIGYEFGLSILTPDHRYFTEIARNPDAPEQHAKVYRNLDSPGMFLIGFENLYGGGDRDYNDMVFSLEPQYYLDVVSPYDTPGGEGWYLNYTTAYATLATGVIDHGNGTRRVFTHWSGDTSGTNYAQSNSILMDGNKTAIANWKTQHYLTVSSAHGAPGGEGWYDSGDTAYATVTPLTVAGGAGIQYVFTGWSGDASGSTSPSDPITMDAPKTAVANWKTQYLVTFNYTGLDATATGTVVTVNGTDKTFSDLPFTIWVDSGDSITYSYSNTVSSSEAGKRFKLIDVTGPTSPVTVTSPSTVTGNYKIQYKVTFDQSGVGADFTGTVVDVDGTGYGVSDLPKSFWWDKDSTHNFSFASPLVVNTSKQYVWTSTSGLSTLQSETLTITSSGTVTGYYTAQLKYQITFDQTGVSADYTGTVVIIDGNNYNVSDLPVSFWWDAGSVHNFSFQSPLVVAANSKRYVWISTSGLSALQSDLITVSASGSITGNYKTQFYLTVVSPYATPGGEGWYDSGSTAYATVSISIVDHGNGTRRVFVNWTGDTTGSGTTSDPITMNAPKTAIANWKTHYYLTVQTDPSGLSPAPTPPSNWYDNCTYVVLTAPNQSYLGAVVYDFAYWDVDGANDTNNPITVHMNQPHTATAHYQPPASYGPTAIFTEDTHNPDVNQTVTFNATLSLPGFNGTHTIPIVNYTWNFGDGNTTTVNTPIITHAYANYGTYNVTLTVYAPGATPDNDTTTQQKTVGLFVGGHVVLIDKLQLLAPQIGLIAFLLAAMVITTVRLRRKVEKP